jgi:hypothetical protein
LSQVVLEVGENVPEDSGAKAVASGVVLEVFKAMDPVMDMGVKNLRT